eukprot:Nk52_evm29s164 gene=Nk52_evmTU29s164
MAIGFGGMAIFKLCALVFGSRRYRNKKMPIDWKVPERKLDQNCISVIIPTLNEGTNIEETISRAIAKTSSNIEVLVCDGGSTDGTRDIVKGFADNNRVSLITSFEEHAKAFRRGRAFQMNLAASHASGGVLLFVHGDTCLPEGYDSMIRNALSSSHIAAGAFQLSIDTDDLSVFPVQYTANLRSEIYGLPYGDQGIFVRTEVFRNIEGYPDLPLMEDYEFVREIPLLQVKSWSRRMSCANVKSPSKITILPAAVKTSARRWEVNGVIANTVLNQVFVILYAYCGVSAELIHKMYYWNTRLYTWNKDGGSSVQYRNTNSTSSSNNKKKN